jgi:predicted DNA-binding transcriptional regulator AlpA
MPQEVVYIGTGEVARIAGVTSETVRDWASSNRPGLPRPARLNGRLKFKREEILAWIEGQGAPVPTGGPGDAA